MILGAVASDEKDEVVEGRVHKARERQALFPIAVGVLPGAVLVVLREAEQGDGGDEVEAALATRRFTLGSGCKRLSLAGVLHGLERDHVASAPADMSVKRMPRLLAASKMRSSR